ncbi:RES family NAD+ phosphorylase [Mesohalobacter halotolerans]|uniref:RES domain-containing protein n=1 Tax=Mesohalobacter halotolerans TaxID=1883405 RepID=A0A4V6XYA5_9FLAO|nr:RES family NAD+ phosphorylase [Mesohalobacter halotolerans]TKS56135.1 RES domain-containing protein [Mesohalobacter halotolerans]
MEVFRLVRQKYSKSLSGKGSALSGNRWNSKGVEMIYTAQSRALAMAEVLVHLPLHQLPSDYKMMCIEIPDSLDIKTLKNKDLPKLWNALPHHMNSQKIGDNFIMQNQFIALKVPSAVVFGDFNYLINPHHKDLNRIKIQYVADFPFDQRLKSL